MRLIGATASGETLTSDEIADGLEALNAMLDQWWLQRLAVYRIDDSSYSWASGEQTRTIGASGADLTDTRPVRLFSAYQRLNSVDYPISVMTSEQYRRIPSKTTSTDLMTHIFYDPTVPNGTLYGYPVPSTTVTIRLQTYQQIKNFALHTTSFSLPPGYEDAMVFNLALRIAPEYEASVNPLVFSNARTTLANIKRINLEVPTMNDETGYMHAPPYYDWRTGD